MESLTHQKTFLRSLARCREKDGFVRAFYERLMESSEEVADKFRATNISAQGRKLVRSLELISSAAAGDPEGLAELRDRATTHDSRHLNIEPGLYAFWEASIMDVAARYDEWWCDEVAEAWQAILGYVIRYMTSRYA